MCLWYSSVFYGVFPIVVVTNLHKIKWLNTIQVYYLIAVESHWFKFKVSEFALLGALQESLFLDFSSFKRLPASHGSRLLPSSKPAMAYRDFLPPHFSDCDSFVSLSSFKVTSPHTRQDNLPLFRSDD